MSDLLSAVKNELDITWDDPQTDRKVTGMIKRGMAYINRAAGSKQDFAEESKARELLFEYCRYARSGALNEFQKNYIHELQAFQQDKEVEAYVASKVQ